MPQGAYSVPSVPTVASVPLAHGERRPGALMQRTIPVRFAPPVGKALAAPRQAARRSAHANLADATIGGVAVGVSGLGRRRGWPPPPAPRARPTPPPPAPPPGR